MTATGRGAGSEYRRLAVYTSIIFLLPATLFGGYWVGSLLDEWLGIRPWGTMGGVLLGGATGFIEVFRLLRRVN